MWLELLGSLLVAIIVYGVYFRWTRRKMFASVREMHGPINLPLIGYSYLFFGKSTPVSIGRVLYKLMHQYPTPTKGWFGPYLVVMLDKPEHCKTVLNSSVCLNKAPHYRFFGLHALLASEGTLWSSRRKRLNLSFSRKTLNGFFGIFNRKARQFIDDAMKLADGVERNMSSEFAKWTLDNITATFLELEIDDYVDKAEYLKKVELYLPYVIKRVFKLHHYSDFIYHLTKDWTVFSTTRRNVREVTWKALDRKFAQKRTEIETDGTTNGEENTSRAKPLLDMLYDMVRDSSQAMTVEEMAHHVDEVIYAGFDTTAISISNVILLLAMHPEVQERVYQEVMAVCPDPNVEITQEDCYKLVYTDMVIKETMRLYPVVPLLVRSLTADLKLDDQFTLLKGTLIAIASGRMQRNPEIWGPQANVFNPDHFLPEQIAQRHPYSYLPFSAGPRNCIGGRFAMLSMWLTVAYFVRAFRIRTLLRQEDLQTSFEMIQRVNNGCLVSLLPR
ncbi:probable cytochrome P450 313a4 [Uranotaenia lowii]|uniref:probable cytochrome P450 313a4 n=1 Tax=Uranotaenia lowii TaxID=190385 RepID=UPI00247A736E|nr:probable cytochrome P450 313a4 [Uranotaenia lowii]